MRLDLLWPIWTRHQTGHWATICERYFSGEWRSSVLSEPVKPCFATRKKRLLHILGQQITLPRASVRHTHDHWVILGGPLRRVKPEHHNSYPTAEPPRVRCALIGVSYVAPPAVTDTDAVGRYLGWQRETSLRA